MRGVQTGRCGGARRRRGTGLVIGEGRGHHRRHRRRRRRRSSSEIRISARLSEGVGFGRDIWASPGRQKKIKKSEGWDSNPAPLDMSTCQLTSGAIGEILSAYHPLSFT
jgi:hypothetical protein